MTDHVEIADERVDFGHAIFLGAFYATLALEAVTTIIGFGQTGSWALGLIGVLNLLILCALAGRLYDGDLQVSRYIHFVGPIFLAAAAIIAAIGEGSHWSILLAIQLALPALFGFLVTTRPARIFFATRRGESLDRFAVADVEVIQEESILVKAEQVVAVREEAKQPLQQQVSNARIAVGILGICAVAGLTLAAFSTRSLWLAFVLAVTGIAALPISAVLWNLADNWSFLTSTKGFEKAHLTNVTRDIRILCNCLIGAITVLALLALIDVSMR